MQDRAKRMTVLGATCWAIVSPGISCRYEKNLGVMIVLSVASWTPWLMWAPRRPRRTAGEETADPCSGATLADLSLIDRHVTVDALEAAGAAREVGAAFSLIERVDAVATRHAQQLQCRRNGGINSAAARRSKQPRCSRRQPLGGCRKRTP
jgi:hypothetical protein